MPKNSKKTGRQFLWLLLLIIVLALLLLVDFKSLFGEKSDNVSVSEIEADVDRTSSDLDVLGGAGVQDEVPDFVE
jgi:hypothetical protein